MKNFPSLRGLSPRTSMSRYVDDFFNDGYRRMLGGGHSITGDELTIPAANVREHHEGSGYIIEIAAPGYRREDFNVSVHDNVLTISAERETKGDNGNDASQHRYTRREHYYHNFERSFMLPDHVNEEEISASYRDGILHVQVPTHQPDTQRRSPRRIDIR